MASHTSLAELRHVVDGQIKDILSSILNLEAS